MEDNTLAAHAATLEAELAWLAELIQQRLSSYFQGSDQSAGTPPVPPDLRSAGGPYAEAVKRIQLDDAGRMALILALAPHLRPPVLDLFFIRNATLDRPYAEFGGWTGSTHTGFLPTVETLLFLLSGQDMLTRLQLAGSNGPVHRLVSADVLERHPTDAGQPRATAPLTVTAAFLDVILGGT